MTPLSPTYISAFWSLPVMEVNFLIFINLLGALLLGLLVGYERSYHGRAAGMRTYGLVCMASAALTVFAGYPGFWWGGAAPGMAPVDPTRVVQGIVTGVGFLGAGVIMKQGLNINGLTTAASIWASSAIGVLVGLGFFVAAVLLALLSASLMMWGPKLEALLPSRHAMGVMLSFKAGFEPSEAALKATLQQWGFFMAEGSLNISNAATTTWRFVMVANKSHPQPNSLFDLSRQLRQLDGVDTLQISHARN